MRGFGVAIAIAGSGCVAATNPDPNQPSRFTKTFATHVGVGDVDEPATDGAHGRLGIAWGVTPTVQYRFTRHVSAGIGLHVGFSHFATDTSPRTASYWYVNLPVASARTELGRYGVQAWSGYYIGDRSITEPGGYFGTKTYSSLEMQGVALTVATLVRLSPVEGFAFEAGPYLQLIEMWSKEDEFMTRDFDEEGMRVQTTSFGLLVQVAFGTGPTR